VRDEIYLLTFVAPVLWKHQSMFERPDGRTDEQPNAFKVHRHSIMVKDVHADRNSLTAVNPVTQEKKNDAEVPVGLPDSQIMFWHFH